MDTVFKKVGYNWHIFLYGRSIAVTLTSPCSVVYLLIQQNHTTELYEISTFIHFCALSTAKGMTLFMKYWELEDVEKTAQNNPDTFFIPSREERNSKKKGDLVRLHFLLEDPREGEPRAERMWVEILRAKTILGKYIGTLTNQPAFITGLSVGDEVGFYPKHIAQTMMKKDDPRWIDSVEKMALASKMCLEKNGVIRFVYREKPDREQDSGWRMFTGNESDEYSNDPRNIQIINVGYLLDKDSTLLEPLKGDYGSAFERIDKGQPWEKIEDWELSE